jgi:hypothetical protein
VLSFRAAADLSAEHRIGLRIASRAHVPMALTPPVIHPGFWDQLQGARTGKQEVLCQHDGSPHCERAKCKSIGTIETLLVSSSSTGGSSTNLSTTSAPSVEPHLQNHVESAGADNPRLESRNGAPWADTASFAQDTFATKGGALLARNGRREKPERARPSARTRWTSGADTSEPSDGRTRGIGRDRTKRIDQ